MPASEETYYPQPLLHLIFAVSSIAMLAATVWMVMADHLRPWKQVQRDFQTIERAKLQASEQEKLQEQRDKSQAQIEEIDAQIQAAEQNAESRTADIRRIDKDLDKLGYKGPESSEVFLSDCRVPAENVLGGEEGHGLQQALSAL